MKHTDITLDRLMKHNPIFFHSNAQKFHKDKSYKIDNLNRILTVSTAYGKVKYSIDKKFKLSFASH